MFLADIFTIARLLLANHFITHLVVFSVQPKKKPLQLICPVFCKRRIDYAKILQFNWSRRICPQWKAEKLITELYIKVTNFCVTRSLQLTFYTTCLLRFLSSFSKVKKLAEKKCWNCCELQERILNCGLISSINTRQAKNWNGVRKCGGN